jgi:hypothetical protein
VTVVELLEPRSYFRLCYLLGRYFLLHFVAELGSVLVTAPHSHNQDIEATRMRVESFIHW